MRGRVHASLKGLTRDTFLLALSSLFADVATEMLFPIFPVFLTQYLHASGSIIGLIDGVAVAVQNISQGVSGWLSDKLQKHKGIALLGYGVAAVSKPLIGVSGHWAGVLGLRALDRLGAGARSAPRDALVASSVSYANRGKAFGLEGFGDNLGACLGPLLALSLLYVLNLKIQTIFLLSFVPGAIGFFMILWVRERRVEVPASARIDLRLSHFPASYWRYLGVTAVFCLGNSSNSFLILHTKNSGISLKMTIVIYAAYNLVAALVSFPAGVLSDKLGRKNLLLATLAVFFLSYLGFGLATHAAVITFLFIFYGLFQGMFRTVGKALAADLVPESLRATGIGWYSTTVGIMGFLSSLLAGILWDNVGHEAVFFVGAATAAVAATLLVSTARVRTT
jgi:MFS family permease